jgi:methylated-DNA-[protein]-cysteine S-methyltransferase
MTGVINYQAIITTPMFNIGVCCNSDEITLIDYLKPGLEQAPKTPLAREAVRQIRTYLKNATFEFGLPRAPAGTAFQRKVWAEIAAIPVGHVTTYGELAKAIRSGPRAVGGACGANPYPIIVPCHRVVAAGGGIGGFGGHAARQQGGMLLDIKRWLLDHEDAG